MEIIAANVRAVRSARGMTQEKLGQACGYSRVYVGDIERGSANITIQTLQALADALDLDPRELLNPPA